MPGINTLSFDMKKRKQGRKTRKSEDFRKLVVGVRIDLSMFAFRDVR